MSSTPTAERPQPRQLYLERQYTVEDDATVSPVGNEGVFIDGSKIVWIRFDRLEGDSLPG